MSAVGEQAGPARPPAALPAAAVGFLLLAAFSPAVESPFFTPKLTVLLVAGAIGLPFLVRLAAAGDRAAWAGAGWVGWAIVTAIASGSALAWSGQFGLGTGAVFVACVAGAWALGRSLPSVVVGYAAAGLVAGTAANAVVGVLQGPFDLSRYSIFLVDDRSAGLLGNPVFLGAASAAGAAIAMGWVRARPALVVPLTALFAAAVQTSGSRVALGMLVVAAGWGAWRARGFVAVVLIGATVLGLVAGTVLAADRTETSAVARVTDPTGQLDARLETWRIALGAAADRPFVGYGPGRHLAAAGPRRTLRLARLVGPDVLYRDAHNLAVEHAATTGFVGLAFLLAWLLLMARTAYPPARPELLLSAGLLLAFHLLEPQNVAVTPTMAFLAGAAASRPPAVAAGRGFSAAVVVLLLLALGLGGRTLIGDVVLHDAGLDFDESAAERATTLLWPWGVGAVAESHIHNFRARAEKRPAEFVVALENARVAAAREPDNPRRHVEVASLLGRLDRHREAAEAYLRALHANPWSRIALRGRAAELRLIDDKAGAGACEELARIAGGQAHTGSAARHSLRNRCYHLVSE